MASRQKSFFDQDHSSRKPRQHPWRPNQLYRRDLQLPAKPTLPKPAILPSTQSRAKLKAFEFHKSQEKEMVSVSATAQEVDKENAGPRRDTRRERRSEESHLKTIVPQDSLQLSTPRAVKQFKAPQTPGISLEDLLDDQHEREATPPGSTPKDQVGWEHGLLRSSQMGPITPSLHRGKKRPRSESPPSSSRHPGNSNTSDQSEEKRALALSSKTPMRTPRYEPGPELWNRYARNELHTPSRPPASVATGITPSSPPEPFASASRSYRRAASDLTHTVRKRRKLDRDRFGKNSQIDGGILSSAAVAPKVRVPFLLEKLKEVTGSVTQQRRPSKPPPPSSPSEHAARTANDELPITSQQLAELVMSNESNKEDDGLQELQRPVGNNRLMTDKLSSHIPLSKPPDNSHETTMGSIGLGARSRVSRSQEDGPGGEVHRKSTPRDSEHGFSDFDIADDDLLSTCLKVEQQDKAPDASHRLIDKANQSLSSNHAASNPQQLPSAHGSTGRGSQEQSNTRGPAGSNKKLSEVDDDFGFDEFDAEDIAEIDLAMSRYTQNTTATQIIQNGVSTSVMENHQSRLGSQNNDLMNTDYDEMTKRGPSGGQSNPVDLVEDEFADEELEEAFAELAEENIEKGLSELNAKQSSTKPKTIQRYLVKSIHDGMYQAGTNSERPEKVLSVEDERTQLMKAVILRGFWVDSPCTPGSYVHVLAEFDKSGQCIIDNDHGIIILHPDHLISATVVADSFKCMRRAVLQDRVKATNDANEPQVYGHIIHEIFQEALKANRWDDEWVDEMVRAVAQRYLESLFEINVDLNVAISHLNDKMVQLKSWAKIFVSATPGPRSSVRDRNGGHAMLSVNKLLDVEEHVWSPMYGLKGNIDATVQVLMRDGEGDRTLTVPLELKTGKNTSNEAHRAQTALYTLLLSDRYDIEVTYGVLFYLEAAEMSRIPGIRLELVHMIKQRNELATYVRNRLELPPMLKKERDCKRCYAQTSCFTYHKLAEDGDGDSSGMKDEFVKKVLHLLPQHRDFFKKWDQLLTLEESDMMKFRRELWTMTSKERQKVGRCFAGVVLEPGSAGEVQGAQKINRFKYSFVKKDPSPYFSFSESQINVGEPIVVSDEQGHYALANGYVTSMRKDRISVAVDRRLHNSRTRSRDFDACSNQSFSGIMEVDSAAKLERPQIDEFVSPMIYRIDKDEFSNGMATVRNNLIRLMEQGLYGAQALRRLIVDKVKPTFLERPSKPTIPLSQTGLNMDQRAAIEKVMTAKDYALVLGMPGTGKTTTIAHIIRALTSQGKSVLLTSYTHTAVDNILLKIRDDKISILRIGAVAKVHPEVAEFADLAADPKADVEELKRTYNSQVVATTCLGINHPIFNQRTFDYCIVDEASQITLPVCLGPIRMARTFILVGDHYQLPPLVQNKDALEGGLDVSLFKYLSDAHPDSVVTLEHQYRMCAEVMSLSNELIYDGRLKCGNEGVATRRISIPHLGGLAAHHHTPTTLPADKRGFCQAARPKSCWLFDAVTPASPVVFLNTDPLGDIAREQSKGSRIVNEAEVRLTAQLVSSLISVGVAAQEIGVITLYRSQLALMRQEMKARSTAGSIGLPSAAASADVEMHTADKYQGRDKEAIVLSFVRSNDADNVGDLLKDWRRVNVALTRARTKLIIVGSWETIKNGSELLGRFCDLVADRGWKYDLKKSACGDHYFEDFATQGSAIHSESAKKGQEITIKPEEKTSLNIGLAEHFKKGVDKENTPAGKPPLRQPGKRARLNPGKLMGRRPVMMNILKESLSPAEQELLGDGGRIIGD